MEKEQSTEYNRRAGVSPAQLEENYFVFLEGVCDNADPAAVFDALPVRLSRSTFEAAVAAFVEVCFVFLAMAVLLSCEDNRYIFTDSATEHPV